MHGPAISLHFARNESIVIPYRFVKELDIRHLQRVGADEVCNHLDIVIDKWFATDRSRYHSIYGLANHFEPFDKIMSSPLEAVTVQKRKHSGHSFRITGKQTVSRTEDGDLHIHINE